MWQSARQFLKLPSESAHGFAARHMPTCYSREGRKEQSVTYAEIKGLELCSEKQQ